MTDRLKEIQERIQNWDRAGFPKIENGDPVALDCAYLIGLLAERDDALARKTYPTRDGKHMVTITCTDAPGQYPMIGYWLDSVGNAIPCMWKLNGKCAWARAENIDLILTPEGEG